MCIVYSCTKFKIQKSVKHKYLLHSNNRNNKLQKYISENIFIFSSYDSKTRMYLMIQRTKNDFYVVMVKFNVEFQKFFNKQLVYVQWSKKVCTYLLISAFYFVEKFVFIKKNTWIRSTESKKKYSLNYFLSEFKRGKLIKSNTKPKYHISYQTQPFVSMLNFKEKKIASIAIDHTAVKGKKTRRYFPIHLMLCFHFYGRLGKNTWIIKTVFPIIRIQSSTSEKINQNQLREKETNSALLPTDDLAINLDRTHRKTIDFFDIHQKHEQRWTKTTTTKKYFNKISHQNINVGLLDWYMFMFMYITYFFIT